jgi:hypothetical protein
MLVLKYWSALELLLLSIKVGREKESVNPFLRPQDTLGSTWNTMMAEDFDDKSASC